MRPGSLADRAVMLLSVAGFTVPSFVLGLVLVLIFAVQLGWLPSGGQDSWRHAVLPVLTLGIGGAAVLARFTRSAMLEVLGQPYIRTASRSWSPSARPLISAVFGTTPGFLAAYFRGLAEQAVLMLADFQASMPFLILALAVLAFFGNSLPLLIGLMGLFGWERYARIARGLAISASAQGYAPAVTQLGAPPVRVHLRHILSNIASTLIVSMTLVFPEVILADLAGTSGDELRSRLHREALVALEPLAASSGRSRRTETRVEFGQPARGDRARGAPQARPRRMASRVASAREEMLSFW